MAYRCRIDSSYECNGCMWCYVPDDEPEDEVTEADEDE